MYITKIFKYYSNRFQVWWLYDPVLKEFKISVNVLNKIITFVHIICMDKTSRINYVCSITNIILKDFVLV